jgi:NodT family efflux transporter outer membrane factor (OMF) lipoprotein
MKALRPKMPARPFRLATLLIASSALCACEVGPNYHRPTTPEPTVYKEIQGWSPATPSDAANRYDWWTVFNDPLLNELEEKVVVSNQTLAENIYAYEQARQLVNEARAQLFPSITGTASANYSHAGAGAATAGTGAGTGGTGGAGPSSSGSFSAADYSLQLGGTWEPDIWGKVRRMIENARATAQADYGTLVNARLSAQMQLAADYITLRELDEEKRIYDETVKADAISLDITRNKYNAGTAVLSDVDTAEATLYSARAQDTQLGVQRGQMEHAIAMLIGEPPANLTIPPAPWTLKPVDIPPGVPSTLLQRRPDVASSERLAAAASAEIGVQFAGYFPDVTLTGDVGTQSAAIAQLFNPSTLAWSLGAQAVQTIFNGGLTAAQVQAARAAYKQSVATYRQTTLAAFQQVEDNLVAQRLLAEAQPDLTASMAAADQALKVTNNEYLAGTVDYTTVVTAEATALNAHLAELTLEATRLTTTVDLIVALGGGWSADDLKGKY